MIGDPQNTVDLQWISNTVFGKALLNNMWKGAVQIYSSYLIFSDWRSTKQTQDLVFGILQNKHKTRVLFPNML